MPSPPPVNGLDDRLLRIEYELMRIRVALTQIKSPSPRKASPKNPQMMPTTAGEARVKNNAKANSIERISPSPASRVNISGERFSLTGLSVKQEALLRTIAKFENYPTEYIRGTRYVRVGQRSYRDDCSNILRIAYEAVGVDLFSEHHRFPSANGVKLIRKKGLTEFASTSSVSAEVGDVIIFDNTFDRNKNGLRDDEDTHAAIVLAVDSDGTVALYNRVASGHRVYRMNVRLGEKRRHPETNARINHVLRRASKQKEVSGSRLTGALFATYVRVLAV